MANTVSVIIPTKNRPVDLDLTVESLFQQSILPIQLIVVDQSQSGEGKERVERSFAEASLALREAVQFCYIQDSTISGGAVARNRAMEIARGDIWFFLDDDVCLEPMCIEELLATYQRYPRASGVSGIISNYQRPPWAYQLWASVFVRGPFHDERQPIYWRAERIRKADPIVVRKLGAGLMSFRAEVIRAHRFDENLIGVSDGEDVDFCVRLGLDAVLMIAPRARLAHKASPIGRAQEHWLRRFARANCYLYHRNWERGIRNRLAFVWLNVGLGLVALLASVKRASLAPWCALREGAREGMQFGRLKAVAVGKAVRNTTDSATLGCPP
jgi:GT2 family glycosyltransferase